LAYVSVPMIVGPQNLPVSRPAAPRPARTGPSGQTQIFAPAFTPDGRALVSGGLDGSIRQWDVAAASGAR